MGTLDPCRLRKKLVSVFVILFCFLNGLNANESCKRGCPVSDRGIFHYKPGSMYAYNFDSVMTISLSSSNSDETSIKVQGHANIFAEPNCGYTLKLDRVNVIQNKDGSGKGLSRKMTEGIDKPVQFTIANGELETQICTDPTDTDYSLNLKRAIISMLQKTEKPHETDIFGVCPTTVLSTHNGNAELITKIRNLNTCKYREMLSNGFVSGMVNERAGIKSTPLLTSDYNQEQEIIDGIIERVQLNEEYKFVPLSNAQNGAGVRARVRTTLKRTKTAPGAAPALNNGVSQSIIFKNPRPVTVDNMDVLRTVLTATVNDLQNHASPKSAQQLTELIRLMRVASQQNLSTLYRDIRSGTVHPEKSLARKIFLDALFRAGTDDTVSTIAKFIETELNDVEKRLAYLSFNLVDNVDEKSLNAINGLFDKNPPNEAYLSIGHLISKYCRQHSCEQNRIVQGIASKFATKLNNCQAKTQKQDDTVVNVLKGIRNAGILANHAIDRLLQCTTDKQSARIRVAALQALSSAACDPKSQSTALTILKNRNEDSEIRIEAYLTLVACPSATVANQIAEIVNSEPVYQIGNFISSHLRGIRDSTDPYRESARHHFSNIRITKKFPVDPRRYSFNQELSYSMDAFGVGAAADFSLIYSQRGFLPRSVRLNLTAEVFGHDFNVFELQGRQENLEQVLEHYLGPKGFFTERSHDRTKEKRSTREEINAIARTLKPYGNSVEKDLLFDYSFKMFGNELVLLSMGEHIPRDSESLALKLSTILDDLTNKAKNFEHDCESHSLFVDSELLYPTGMGFPLQLVVQGAGIGRMLVAANLDLKDLPSKWKNGQYRIKFVPSVNIDINGLMKVDAQVLSTGLKVHASLHTSTGSDVTFKINNAKDFNIDIEVPFKKQEIINFDHEIEFIVEDPTKETVHVPMIKGKRNAVTAERCFDQLSLFGLTICGIISRPVADIGAPAFPLNGPTKLSLSLETEKKIQLSSSYIHETGKEIWLLNYDTPGSQRPHTTEMKFELGTMSKWYGRASFKHPEKFLAAEAGLSNTEQELIVYGQYEHDKERSIAKFGLTKSGPNEYRPLIHIQTKDKPIDSIAGYRADGKIIAQQIDQEKRYNFENIRILDPTNRATTLNGWFSLLFPEAGGPGWSMDMKITNADNKNYEIKNKFAIKANHYVASMSILNEANPSSSGAFSWELKHPEGNVHHDMVISHGPQLKYSYEIHNDFTYEPDKSKPRFIKFQNSLGSKEPLIKFKLNGQYAQNLVEYDLEGNFRKAKLGSSLILNRNQKSNGDYDADLTVTLNNYKADVKAKRTIQDGTSVLDHTLSTSWGTKGSFKGKVAHRFTPIDAHIDLQGNIQFTDKDEPIGAVIVYNATPKNSQGNIKLTRGEADIVTFSGTYVRGDNANGKFDVTVKDVLVGKGEMKSKSGSGDSSILINLKKLNRKIKIDSKYTITAPTYNLDTILFYDFEKDNAKKITLNTKNQIDRRNINSINALEINEEKYSLTMKGHHDGEFIDGNVNGEFSLGLPNGRQLSGVADRKMTRKDDAADGYAKAKLIDRQPDGKERSLEMDAKFSGMNPKARLFDVYHKFTYKNFDGKDAIFESHLKHLPKDHFKMAESSFSLKGTMIEEPLEISLTVDEYCKEHAVYRMSGKYGDTLQGNLNGNYHVGGRAKPATYAIQMNLDAPKTDFKNFKLESSGSLLRPDVDGGIYEGKVHASEQLGDIKLNFDGTAKGNANHGSWSIQYDSPKTGAGKLDGNYLREENDGNGKYQLNTVYEYGQSKVIKMNLDAGQIAEKSLTFHYTLQTPNEHAKNLEVVFKGERTDDRTYIGNVQMTHNAKSYGFNTAAVLSDTQTSADVTIEYPGRTAKFYAGAERLGEHKGRAKLKIDNFGEFTFDGTAETSYQSAENFYLKIDLDSKKLKLDRLHIEANSQPKSNGKGVEFKATEAGKNILSGNAEYTVKTDKSKVIVEGQGNVQLYEKPRQANFKLVRQMYEMTRDSELGYSYTFNGQFGPKNIVSEVKMTSKNLILKLASCEEKKQCTNFEIRSVTIIEKDQFDMIQHKLMILIDLKELGYPHEFELQSKLARTGLKFEHELEMNVIGRDNSKYQFQTYIKPTKSGVILKMPRREVALENVYTVPNEVFGRYEASATLYLDKTGKPNEKTSLSFVGDLNRVEKTAINSHAQLKFTHPTIKPLSISGSIDLNSDRKLASSRIEIDIFKSANQKIIATAKYQNTDQSSRGVNITTEAKIKSDGLNFEYGLDGHTAVSFERYELSMGGTIISPQNDLRISGYVSANTRSFEIATVAFNEPLFNAHGTISPKSSKISAQFSVLGSDPIEFKGQSTGLTSMNFQLQRKTLYNIDGKINVGKEATIVMTGSGKELFNGKIALDAAHFLSTQYKVSDEDVKEFLKALEDQVKKNSERTRTEIDGRFTKVRQNYEKQIASLKESIPDFSGIQNSYESNVQQIIDELSADPSIKDIIEFYKRIFDALSHALKTISQVVAENYGKLSETAKEMYEKLSKVFTEKLLPLFQKTMQNIATILTDWYAETIKAMTSVLQSVAKVLKTFEADFNRIGKAFAEFYKTFNTAVSKLTEVIRKEFEDIIKLIRELSESLPGWENIKATIKKNLVSLESAKQVAIVLNDMLVHIEDFLPTKEFQSFINKLHDYIEAKISEQEVNDIEQIKDLYVTLFNAIRSLMIQMKAGEAPSSIFYPIPFTLDALRQIPIWTTVKFSPFNYLRNEQWSSLKNIFAQKHPRDISIPIDLHGHIADGEHIFTFDGRHMTFPGSCSYVLVQDLDNKFSVIGNLQDGKLKSIILTDANNMVEISADGQVKLNDKSTDLPVHNKEIHAWRRYHSVSALTEYGAELICTLDLRVCHVNVNGYYTGKTRGILGNGNNEPYDDFTLPNGKVTDNYAEFGNAYALTPSCQPVHAQEHHQHQHDHSAYDPICKELFDSDSSLLLGYIFTDPSNYLEACNHAVSKSSDKQDAACNIALTYASALRFDHIPIELPEKCLKCKRTGRSIGDEFEAKTPQKKADIIFVIDTGLDTLLNDLVQNVIIDLRGQLKLRDITDVNVIVIGYNENMRYPQIYTSNGSLDFTGKLEKVNFSGAPMFDDRIKTGTRALFNTYLDRFEKIISNAVAPSDARAFNLAMDYPFRPDANRAIIAVRNDQLEYSNMLKITGAVFSNVMAKAKGITLHLIGPIKEFQLAGKPQQQGNVVGFNSRVAIMLGDAKKRSNFGSTEIRSNIKYTSDMGIDFVQNDGGYVFPLQNFEAIKDKPKERKQFTMAIGNALADQISRIELTNWCKCDVVYGVLAEETCIAEEQGLATAQQKKPAARS